MKLFLLIFCVLWILVPDPISQAEPPAEGSGPFPTRNYSPIQLLFLSLPVEKAATVPRGSSELSLGAAESNTILVKANPNVDVLMKFETVRSALQIKHGFTDRFEAGIEVPFYYRNGGFLDPFIIRIEKAFRSLNLNRHLFNDGSFGGFMIKRDGEIILSGGDRQSGLGDVSLNGKYTVLQEGPVQPAMALRGAVKFPTGDFDRAFGSGKTDVGAGLVLQKSMGRRWVFYLNQSVVDPGGRFGTTDLTLHPIYSAALAAEFLFAPSLSIVGQFDYYTTPFRHAGDRLLDQGVAEAVLGFNYRFKPRLLWQLYGIENFADPGGASADFTLGTNITCQF
ncbi:MAG TPA: DUF3187 family protein [Nitrospiria bacterium]|nr:DUF3187 family protein [Nitrospiria bacterium]